MELLKIATAYFITKCDGQLLQIATAFLLQSATRYITNCDRYYKMRWIYYKLRQVLQSAMIITNCDSSNPSVVSVSRWRHAVNEDVRAQKYALENLNTQENIKKDSNRYFAEKV